MVKLKLKFSFFMYYPDGRYNYHDKSSSFAIQCMDFEITSYTGPSSLRKFWGKNGSSKYSIEIPMNFDHIFLKDLSGNIAFFNLEFKENEST